MRAPTQAKSQSLGDYISSKQDAAKSALNKSMEAAYLAWTEALKADEAQFMSEKILNLGKESWRCCREMY